MRAMNDVPSILAGYAQTPHLFPESVRWWRGQWIQVNIPAFRPVSAYLYWSECWIGMHAGWVWNGWIGYALLVVNACLSSVLAWRLTQSRACLLLAGGLATQPVLFNASQPRQWLIWFPVHQDLLMSALLLGALLQFDRWRQTASRRALLGCWVCFVLGALAKEHVYIFPLLALADALLWPGTDKARRRQGAAQAGLMALTVGALWVYRASVIAHPRNPHPHAAGVAEMALLYLYNTVYRVALSGEWWLAGLAVLLCVLVGAARRWGGRLRLSAWIGGSLAAVWLYLTLATGSAAATLWLFVDGNSALIYPHDLLFLCVTLYGTWLLWKRRRDAPTGAAWAFLFLSYAPVLNFMGWHYALPAWFVRAAYDALIGKLMWQDALSLSKSGP